MKPKVTVTREVFDETLAYLAQHVELTSNQSNEPYGRDGLAGRLQGMDGAVIMTTDRVDDALLSRCPQLRVVSSASVGYNHIDLAACTRHVRIFPKPGTSEPRSTTFKHVTKKACTISIAHWSWSRATLVHFAG